MSFWKSIFGSGDTVDKAVDAAVRAGDALVYTAEEKDDFKLKFNDWMLRYMEATQPQNIARRFIAMVIVGLWAFLILLACLVWKFWPDWSGFLFGVLSDIVNEPFMIIMGFYFLTHALRSWQESKK